MSPSQDPVQPTPFEAARTEPAKNEGATTPGGPPRWVIPALGALLLVAALVVFWLPQQVADRPGPPGEAGQQADGPQPAGPADRSPAGKPLPPTGPDASPWTDAQLAKLRKEAQDVLAELLEIQFALQERGVEQWAGEAFAGVTVTATEGDELYRQREYEQATGRYREGLDTLLQLQDSLPSEVDMQLEIARQAIEDRDTATAVSALDLAELMEPENAALVPLRERVLNLPQLLELLEAATTAQASGDLASAEQALREAAALDPEHRHTATELARVADAHLRQQFNDAMSDGYTALDKNRFDSARSAFRKAAQLQPGSAEAAGALQEVDASETADRLARLKRQGEQYEKQERWQDAVTAYEKARSIDPNVTFAGDGLNRSGGRARLDKQFRAAIDEPERLADEKVARATEALLAQARKITPRGAVLKDQIAQLERLLARANKPIAVTLYSDMETEVILYKVARLGRFQQHQLELRPGTYTAVGQRNGFRDVRREFTVSHNAQAAPVTISCTEPI